MQHVRTLQDERTKLLLEMNDITVDGGLNHPMNAHQTSSPRILAGIDIEP